MFWGFVQHPQLQPYLVSSKIRNNIGYTKYSTYEVAAMNQAGLPVWCTMLSVILKN